MRRGLQHVEIEVDGGVEPENVRALGDAGMTIAVAGTSVFDPRAPVGQNVGAHGFPRHWYLWRHQLREFARDHTVVALDQRGYNLSSKPDADIDYGVWLAVEDVKALVAQLGHERFVLVGHDWGGSVSWSFALHHPDLLQYLVILNATHPALLDRELRENSELQNRAQFMLALRRPEAASLAAENDFARLRHTLDFPFIDDADREEYVAAWRQQGALRAMLAWYRREGIGPPTDDGTPARGN